MANTKTLPGGMAGAELATLLAQLSEQKSQIEQLMLRVDKVLRAATATSEPSRKTVGRGAKPSRHSSLDKMKAVMEATADLREANGNLSAARVAKVFGVSVSQLAGWLGRTKQAISKTPDADSLQDSLRHFERVARWRMMAKDDVEFRQWLRTPHELLENKAPLELLAKGEWQAVADYVEDALTGAPT